MLTLPREANDRIAEAVAAAEQCTSAEFKVIVMRYCWIDIRQKARSLFYKHKLDKTKQRNAVLILLVLANREFLIYGDKGINEKVEEGFWLNVSAAMREKFRRGALVEGLSAGIEQIAAQLATHFPRAEDDVNEICDAVIHEG